MSEAKTAKAPVVFERSYEATVEELWAMWTTRDGFEAWWGPRGFRVEVHAIDPTVGGALVYDMIAAGEDEIAFMKREGMPLSHGVRATFTEVDAPRALTITSVIDFIPGVGAYENKIRVEFSAEGTRARMVVAVDAHPDDEWTKRASAGMESQLTKLPDALVSRR
ncbi:MAG: SRPBCC domain-containing protein [Polyangiales bacterium]